MKIGICGKGWRRQMTEDMLQRAGIIAEIKDGLVRELTLVSAMEPGEGKPIENFVRDGGNVILLHPERELLSLFGEELMYTHDFPMLRNLRENIPFSFLQVFPPVSLVRPAKCEIWASFALDFTPWGDANRTSRYPAIAWREMGKGRIGMFFYDLPSTILLLQQGREFFASDSDFPVPVSEKVSRAAYLTYGLLNSALQHLPQAYFHELLLLTLSRKLAEKHSPVPRVWQFPFPHTTALLLSGDSDWLGRAGLKRAWKKVLGWGGEYTQMIVMDDLNQFSAREIAEWKDRGIEFGLHYFCGYKPTPDDMRKHLSKARRLFLKKKLGFTSCRGHSIVWVGWDEQVKMMEEAGLDLSSNMLDYYHWGVSQGLPYPLYTKQGRSGIHELQIFSADDPTFFDKSGIPPIGPHEALLKMTGVLNVMNETYYQPLNALFHPAYFVSITPDSSEWIGGTIQHARRNSIPVMGVNRFFSSWKKRSELLRTCGRKIAPDSKTLERFGEFGVALPELWNGRRIKAEGKPLPGTGEILLPLKEAVKARYE